MRCNRFWVVPTLAVFMLMIGSTANSAVFYPISGVTSDTAGTDFFPAGRLIEGAGVGFDVAAPHDRTSGLTWVTNAPNGGSGDYFNPTPTPRPRLVFDLGSDVDLGEISVWGYADTNANGANRFSLQFATAADGVGGFGSSIAYNPIFSPTQLATPRQSFDFNQVFSARYVELTPLDNFFGISPPGGDRVGLGEVAFEVQTGGPQGPPPEATILKPVSVSTNITGDAGSSHLYLLDDNPGFTAASLQRPTGTGVTLETGDPLSDALETVHERSGTAHAESWTRSTGFGNPEFVFDLTGGGDTPVESILLWQYGNSSPGNSARDFELIFHTETEGNVFLFASGGGTEASEFTGTMDAASPYTTAANIAQLFSFAPETARYVGLRIANNYLGILSPGGDRYGLGEVRFVAPAPVVPEPSTFALAAFGLLGLGWCGRRRRRRDA